MIIEFLKSIFLSIDADAITSVFVLLIFFIFTISVIYTIIQTIKWNKLIVHKMFTSNELIGFYKKYQSTFVSDTKKTHIHSKEIFSINSIRPTYNVIRSTPNMLVGLGILGTFIGLTRGVAPLATSINNSGDTQVLMDAATVLLSGMTTAFMTSVFGMGTSLILGLIIRLSFGTTYKRFGVFWQDLDDKHYISDSEFELIELGRLKNILIETFGKRIDDRTILPSSLLYNLSENSTKTVTQLEAFSSELADGLMLSTDTIQAIQDKLGNSFTNLFDGKMQPLFEQMVNHLEVIKNKNEDDTSKFIGELKESLQQMVGNFQNQISEGATDQVKELNGIMLQTASSLNSIPSMLENTQSNFSSMLKGFEGAGDQIIEKMMLSYDKVANSSLDAQNDVINSSQQLINEINNSSKNATVEITNAVGSLVDKQVKVSSDLDSLLNRFNSIREGTADTQESINSQIRELLTASTRISKASSDLESVFDKTNSVIDKTVEVSNLLIDSGTSLSTAQKEFSEIAFKNLNETKSYLNEHLKSFEDLKAQTSSLFEEINKGVKTYEETANLSINQYLGSFATKLAAAADELSGTYSTLKETIEELGDLFEAINKNKK